jgi:FMN-dependent NADH-azoreductase
MSVLLNIQSSPRYDNSLSRTLSNQFIEQWKMDHPNGQVVTRDLMKTELPFISPAWLGGAFMPAEKQTPDMIAAMQISDELVAELKAADQLLIGVPMHNYNVPANFKAYIDQVVRFNHTYNLNGGMLADKPTTIILASGRLYTTGASEEGCNYVTGFLNCILGYIGITSIKQILAGGMRAVNLGQDTFENYVEKYRTEVIAAAQQDRQRRRC